ncbi:MAG: hypothetical protein E7292_04560 [Lachnospiraceae bacterium]|nr:hypothetical protein [Lachnospiraceae bacterium]
MIKALIESLIEVGNDEKVVYLVADDKEVYDGLVAVFPTRTFNIGIAECNGISLAAGLENGGYKPYVIGGCTFMAFRAYDFIRVQMCMQRSNVKVIGIGAGLAISILGNTQHATEDLSSLRALPYLKVITPSTPTEVRHAVNDVYENSGPAYVRVGRSCGVDFYDEGVCYVSNKMQKILDGEKLLIFSTGSILCKVLEVAKRFTGEVGVIDVHTISPLDVESLKAYAKENSNWMSVEEHNLNGGLGSALAEAVVDNRLEVSLHRFGLKNQFADGYGNYEQIKEKNGLGIEDIYRECLVALEGIN